MNRDKLIANSKSNFRNIHKSNEYVGSFSHKTWNIFSLFSGQEKLIGWIDELGKNDIALSTLRLKCDVERLYVP